VISAIVPADMPDEVFAPADVPAFPAPSGFFGHVSHVSEVAGGGVGGAASAASALETPPCAKARKPAIVSTATAVFREGRKRMPFMAGLALNEITLFI
jgi:hypothetical protein